MSAESEPKAKSPTWTLYRSSGAKLATGLLTIYVEPKKGGGWEYRVCGSCMLRWSLKPLETIEEAKAKSLKVAGRLLAAELRDLATISAEDKE